MSLLRPFDLAEDAHGLVCLTLGFVGFWYSMLAEHTDNNYKWTRIDASGN